MILSLDTETLGVDVHHGLSDPFFVTIFDGKEPLYWEWTVDPIKRKPAIPSSDLVEIAEYLDNADEIVLQNSKFDIQGLTAVGMEWKDEWWDKVHDTLYAAHILASGEPHDLTTLALKYLRFDIRPYEDKLTVACKEARKIAKDEYKNWRVATETDPMLPSAKGEKLHKFDMHLPRCIAIRKQLEPTHHYWTVLSEYSNTDSVVTRPIWEVQKKELHQRGLWKIYLERRKLIRIIYDLERQGMTYNVDRLQEMYKRFTAEYAKEEANCKRLSGGMLDKLPKSGSSNALRDLLLEKWQLPIFGVSKKTQEPSIDKKALDHWEQTLEEGSTPHSFIKALKTVRKKGKGIGDMEQYERFGRLTKHSDTKVLHASYNSTGQKTLRWSSKKPNAENISKRIDTVCASCGSSNLDEARVCERCGLDLDRLNIRYCFGPAPGREWWSLDYENIELRIPAYECNETKMVELFEKPDKAPYFGKYHLLVFDILHPDMFKKDGIQCAKLYKDSWYQWTKNGNFAVQYGAMEQSGTADRAYHVQGAQRQIKSRFKNISLASDACVALANRQGYVETVEDRECGKYPLQTPRIEWGNGGASVKPTVPWSYHIQSTAMWCMCRAMVRVYDYLRGVPGNPYICAQIHDELLIDMPKGKRPNSNLPRVLEIKRLMEMSGEDISVPLKVSISFHPHNWKDEVEVSL